MTINFYFFSWFQGILFPYFHWWTCFCISGWSSIDSSILMDAGGRDYTEVKAIQLMIRQNPGSIWYVFLMQKISFPGRWPTCFRSVTVAEKHGARDLQRCRCMSGLKTFKAPIRSAYRLAMFFREAPEFRMEAKLKKKGDSWSNCIYDVERQHYTW